MPLDQSGAPRTPLRPPSSCEAAGLLRAERREARRQRAIFIITNRYILESYALSTFIPTPRARRRRGRIKRPEKSLQPLENTQNRLGNRPGAFRAVIARSPKGDAAIQGAWARDVLDRHASLGARDGGSDRFQRKVPPPGAYARPENSAQGLEKAQNRPGNAVAAPWTILRQAQDEGSVPKRRPFPAPGGARPENSPQPLENTQNRPGNAAAAPWTILRQAQDEDGATTGATLPAPGG
jgi:hypothetical protein